jgi:hypothetical protein
MVVVNCAPSLWWWWEFTSYFTNIHPGTARHGSQSFMGLQAGVVGVVVVVGLEGVGLDGVVLGGVEGESVGRAIVWHLGCTNYDYSSKIVIYDVNSPKSQTDQKISKHDGGEAVVFLSMSISDHYQISLVWSGLPVSGSKLCE